MTTRILADWLGPEACAFRLSTGKVVQIPTADLDALGRACLNASIEARIAASRAVTLDGVERPAPPARGSAA